MQNTTSATQPQSKSNGQQKKVQYTPELEKVMPKLNLSTKSTKYVVFGLNADGTLAMEMDPALGVAVAAVKRMDTVWYVVHDAIPQMLRNGAIHYVWPGTWNDKHGKYLFSGELLAEGRAISTPGATAIPGSAELVQLIKTATELNKLLKDKKAIEPAHTAAIVTQTFAALRALGLSRSQIVQHVRTAAPELGGSQPQQQPQQ